MRTILIIEDHPIIVDAYKKVISTIEKNNKYLRFQIHEASNCEDAYIKITNTALDDGYDIIFLDISIPPSRDGHILSGEDLGLTIRELHPKSKIIIGTTHDTTTRIKSLIRNINPEGFLIKSEINLKEITDAVNTINEGGYYYSNTVLNVMKRQVINEDIIDRLDREILYELSVGTRMKELPQCLPLSMRSIEKRKQRMKEIFGIENDNDKTLLFEAKEHGFI